MKKLYYFLLLLLLLFIFQSCSKDDNPVNTNVTGTTTVTGTLTIPAPATGKPVMVIIDNDMDGDNGYNYLASGTCKTGTSGTYTFNKVGPGTYYIYAVVFLVGNTTVGPQSGDYYGVYGGTMTSPPQSPNATVPASGTVTFDINLVTMP